MWQPVYPKRFLKSFALCKKRGCDTAAFEAVALSLMEDRPLPDRCRPHKLSGYSVNRWECHIRPDWLLIYRYDEERKQIIFEDTGTHSDLF